MGCLNSIRVLGLSAALAFAASPVIKVDFDMSGRNSSEVTEPNYVPWVVSGVASKDTTLSGVKVNVAGKVFDGSLQGKLEGLKRHLLEEGGSV